MDIVEHPEKSLFTNPAIPTQDQMRKADTRLNNLRELLHHAGLPPMTSKVDADQPHLVLKRRLRHKQMHLVGTISSFSEDRDHSQFLPSLGHVSRTTLMAKIRSADNLTWVAPLQKAQSISVTLLNRIAEKNSSKRLVDVILRSVDDFMGRARHADVKIALTDDNGRQHLYFAR